MNFMSNANVPCHLYFHRGNKLVFGEGLISAMGTSRPSHLEPSLVPCGLMLAP